MRQIACVGRAVLVGMAVISGVAAARPLEILPESRVREIQSQLPPVWDPWLRDHLLNDDTMWYDRSVIVPGYQDSFGDNKQTPIGFRPNTIDRGMINFAVPGGHEDLFFKKGEFHFPFSRSGRQEDAPNTFVVDFWRLPRENGKLLPVVYWREDPNGLTHRYYWMFPIGTVFGEIIFIQDSGNRGHIFEIRTRERTSFGWTVDVYRPFPTATEFADTLELKRREKESWANSSAIARLLSHARDASTLKSDSLGGSHFKGAFSRVQGGTDYLPDAGDETLIRELLHETPFVSAKGLPWKAGGGLTAWAASTQSNFSIVPARYNAAQMEVSDPFCQRCHENAGSPFKDYYPRVLAYGELWGEDDIFSWHPFETAEFVDGSGAVRNFNYDNRKIRQDFSRAGLIEKYNPSVHKSYSKLSRPWKPVRYP